MMEKRRRSQLRSLALEARRRQLSNVDRTNLVIQVRPIASLKPYARNARTHSANQIRRIADSIRQFGFINPILVDADGGVIAGHGRLEAAKFLNMQEVPTIRLDRMTEAQKRAYIIADNKLAQKAGWDRELLAAEFNYISELDVNFDLTITGFGAAEIKVVLDHGDASGKEESADHIPEVGEGVAPVTRVGDFWTVGEHRVLCGDPRAAQSFERLLGGARADMVFVDTLCNVRANGHGARGEAVRYPELSQSLGEMSEQEVIVFLKTVLGHLASHSIDGSFHFICMDRRCCFELLSAGRAVYTEFKDLCVWSTGQAGAGSLYRSGHELIFVFKNGSGPYVNSRKSGRPARKRSNLWDYPGANSPREGRRGESLMSTGAKPVALVADAILDCSKRNGGVLDCFAGSGTTLIAAEKTGRRAYAMDLNPANVDLAIRRYQRLTGHKARESLSGRSFSELKDQRCSARSMPGDVEEREDTDER